MRDQETGLREVFGRLGAQRGFGRVEARYHPYKEFKSTWVRRPGEVSFRISDYLSTTREELLSDFAHSLYDRMGDGRGMRYSDSFRQYLRSREFLDRNRPLYLGRSRNLSLSPKGRVHDLEEAFERLSGAGLIDGNGDAYLTWTASPNRRRMGYCSVLMKVIAISSLLDSPEVPEFVTDYVLYHELLHIVTVSESLSPNHGPLFRSLEARFPKQEEAERWLRDLAADKSAQR